MITELVEMEGHLIDSLLLPKVLDLILSTGGDYRTLNFEMGRSNSDVSRARIEVRTETEEAMSGLLADLHIHGVNRVDLGVAELAVCDQDGVLPADFFSTSNLPTSVRLEKEGPWLPVENPEMDCGLLVTTDNRVRTVPMHRARAGDRIAVGSNGIRVELPERNEGETGFEFMNSEVSPEKPKALLVANVARRISEVKAGSKGSRSKVLAVCGPALIHTGAGPALADLVRNGWIDAIFAGNGFATHDIESNVMGTSLGISVKEGHGSETGHSNHVRVLNEVRRHGSIAAAVDAGYITGGVMYECVVRGVPFVLAGSVRDDGPLPDVESDVLVAADLMRSHVPAIGVALMLSSTLHGIATGNLLPAEVETYCVDINQSVVTKLSDRGSHQARGIVTDVGLFVSALAQELSEPAPKGKS